MANRKVDRHILPGVSSVGFSLTSPTEATTDETLRFYALTQDEVAADENGTELGWAAGGAAGTTIIFDLDLSLIAQGAWYEVRVFSFDDQAAVVRQCLPNQATASRVMIYVAPAYTAPAN